MPEVVAYAATSATSPLERAVIQRREPREDDVSIEILYCGVCHSDIHFTRSEWPGTPYPCTPGHEIIGRAVAVGSKVTKFNVGDVIGIGCIVDSCRGCEDCEEGLENYCNGMVGTYGGTDELGPTKGGYSKAIVVQERYCVKVTHPEKDLAAAAPLLCAGITLWSPLRHWKAGPGKRVGIVGLGGLGHMGVKFGAVLGAEVYVFSTSESKRADAIRLGAKGIIISKDVEQMKSFSQTFDLIINTVGVSHDLDPFIDCLKRDGTLVLVGAPEHPHKSPHPFPLIMRRRRIAGSGVGGLPETQEMMDFCAAKGITSDIELIDVTEINDAYERVLKSDVKYRFVIDIAKSLK